jgi:hypothetical protein
MFIMGCRIRVKIVFFKQLLCASSKGAVIGKNQSLICKGLIFLMKIKIKIIALLILQIK